MPKTQRLLVNQALFDAIGQGNLTEVRRLLEQHKSTPDYINAQDSKKNSPLHAAIEAENLRLVQLLLANGANIGQVNRFQRTPLHLAVGRVNAPIVEALTATDPNIRKTVNTTDSYGLTPLMCAVTEKDRSHSSYNEPFKEILHHLLKSGADINVTNKEGYTVLHKAISKDRQQRAIILLEHGADPHKKDKEGMTPYMLAEQRPQNMRMFLTEAKKLSSPANEAAATAQPSDAPQKTKKRKQSALHDEVLAQPAKKTKSTAANNTELLEAVKAKDLEKVKTLLANGADIDAQESKTLKTPLIHAVKNEDEPMVTYLLAKGADTAKTDSLGWRAVEHAAARLNLGILKKFLEDEPELPYDHNGKTLLMYAANSTYFKNNITTCMPRFEEVLNFLVGKYGEEILNQRDNEGKTAAHYIATNKGIGVLNILETAGADITLQDNDDYTPEERVNETFAKRRGYPQGKRAAIRRKRLPAVSRAAEGSDDSDAVSLHSQETQSSSPEPLALETQSSSFVERVIASRPSGNSACPDESWQTRISSLREQTRSQSPTHSDSGDSTFSLGPQNAEELGQAWDAFVKSQYSR